VELIVGRSDAGGDESILLGSHFRGNIVFGLDLEGNHALLLDDIHVISKVGEVDPGRASGWYK
jgi:hypothetical protein